MKKLTYLFMTFLLVFLAACSSNELTSKEENAETKKEEIKKEEAETKEKAEAEAKAKAEASASSTTTSGGSEFFANCTELRKVYPKGVPADHPAYQSKMDRDKDNYACEN
jgi:hypothetical protein